MRIIHIPKNDSLSQPLDSVQIKQDSVTKRRCTQDRVELELASPNQGSSQAQKKKAKTKTQEKNTQTK